MTCLYRGVAAPTLGSRLEALGIASDFVSGVLSASSRKRIALRIRLHAGVSPPRSPSNRRLRSAAGLPGRRLRIGGRIAATGKRVELSPAVVTTFLPAYTMREFFRHQLRWSANHLDARPWDMLGCSSRLDALGISDAGRCSSRAVDMGTAGDNNNCAPAARIRCNGVRTRRPPTRYPRNERQFFRNVVLLLLRDLIAPFVGRRVF